MSSSAAESVTADRLHQQAAYEKYAPAARALSAHDVTPRGDVALAYANTVTGLDAVITRRADLEAAWPKPRVDALAEVLTIATATVFAAARAEELGGSDGALRKLIADNYTVRTQLLAVAEMAGAFELVPPERVAKIRAGRGSLDAGQDTVALVALVREFAAPLAGKTPLTPTFLAGAEQLGNAVVASVRPKGAADAASPAAAEANALANAMWTLLVRAYPELRKAGFELWGDAVGDHVPLLQSRDRVIARKEEPAPTT